MYRFNKHLRGFTLLEVLVAIGVLSIGLMATAALISRTLQDTVRSRQMSLAAVLASEKLEDLSRWPASDPHVAVPPGGTAGSLTDDVTADVVVGASVTRVNYFDDVSEGLTPGSFSETVSSLDPTTGQLVYTTTMHSPDGSITTSISDTPPIQISYKRRWLIEADQPVPGVRRITVVVTTLDPVRPVRFQMSTVRP
ncbi:MAG: prepilin-type N-terminal cleavage/methylation domain-containing protein [Firmicutes bacterium]|nr:prepilin-type N-terminal cleavage/methylation domain-containing protein [Bacillota bacterium]